MRQATKPAVRAQDVTAATLAVLDWNVDEREDNWLISYADLLSVIFAMVVLLFGKMTIVSAPTPNAPSAPSATEPERRAEPPSGSRDGAVASGSTASSREDRVANLIEARFRGQLTTERREHGLQVTIPDVALFDSGRAQLQEAAQPLLAQLAATLREGGETRISVEGHTDNVPVRGGAFASNWDLASARANAVTRYLLEQGFEPSRLQSVSYADTRPVAGNDSDRGRAANRRVELEIRFVEGG